MKKAGLNIYMSAALGIVLLLSIFVFTDEVNATGNAKKDLLDMSLEELMEVSIETSGSLTSTDKRINPSTITTITKGQIRSSGARSLDELLDIYVPNLQLLRDRSEFGHMGLRGVNSDRDDKYLLLVNGREMNEHTHYGALSERDLPMLTDIHHVDVIRGPGSSMYGAGAIAMVINIITENYKTFQGTQVTTRVGAIEEFYSTEVKHGKKISDDRGYFIYAGTTKYIGADEDNSPIHTCWDDLAVRWYDDPAAEHRQQPDDHGAWRDLPKHKFFGEYDDGNFTSWIRFTRGGEQFPAMQTHYVYPQFYGEGYQQLAAFIGYTQELTDQLDIEYNFSYDMFDTERAYKSYLESHREDEYIGKIIARWNPVDNHSFALGGSISREVFGLRSPGYPHADPTEKRYLEGLGVEMPTWWTTTRSGFGEYKWNITPKWTLFLGARVDDGTYTRSMYSPRASIIYTPTDIDTLKFTYSRSVRMGNAAEMRVTKDYQDKLTSPEQIQVYELRYERQHTKNIWFAGSVFFNNYDLTGYDSYVDATAPLGNLRTIGAELEAIFKTDKLEVILSHGYVKLLSFKEEPGIASYISAQPYGYGDDLANWNNHVTKMVVDYKADDKLSLNASARVYWGMPGAADFARYQMDNNPGDYPPMHMEYFNRPSVFLNLGVQYKFSKNLLVRLDGHNLLGFFDDEINKTMFGYESLHDFRSSAPAFTLTLQYDF